ncbi:MAG: hypothetical protein R2681_01775 [Pyrinomonadaceae bacterium]
MFVVLYRWKIDPEREEQFIKSWSEITGFYLDNLDSLGSRLHKGNDGLWYGYAQWRSAKQRDDAFRRYDDKPSDDPLTKVRKEMSDAILERLPEIPLKVVSDHLK